MIDLCYLNYRYEHPTKVEPVWKSQIERWYQLDAYAYGLAQAYTVLRPKLGVPPAILILASPQGSLTTDYKFVQTGAMSPALFVHTLSSVRASPLCQVMDWSGQVVCIQNDPSTQIEALREAAALMDSMDRENETAAVEGRAMGPVWVMSARKSQTGYEVDGFVLNPISNRASSLFIRKILDSNPSKSSPSQSDSELQLWLASPGEPTLSLGGGYELQRNL